MIWTWYLNLNIKFAADSESAGNSVESKFSSESKRFKNTDIFQVVIEAESGSGLVTVTVTPAAV
jgi:hypothetical protein